MAQRKYNCSIPLHSRSTWLEAARIVFSDHRGRPNLDVGLTIALASAMDPAPLIVVNIQTVQTAAGQLIFAKELQQFLVVVVLEQVEHEAPRFMMGVLT
jgi:hypothetical protein